VKYTDKFLQRARIAGQLLEWVPFMRMAGLNGSIVRGEETEKSDIDFLIIARHGRLYTARFFATIFVHLTGWRRYGDKIAGRICLNCYLSDKKLDITPRDPKSLGKVARAYKYLIPLVDINRTSNKFFEINKWFCGYKVAGSKYQRKLIDEISPRGPEKPVRFFEIYLKGSVGNWVEKKLMDYQVKRIVAGKKTGDETVATQDEIRLHPKKQ